MITTFKIPYDKGELRIGWASWDDGSYTARSIKYAYTDSSGKISRGSPELPFDILVSMVMLAAEQNELEEFRPKPIKKPRSLEAATTPELQNEKKTLTVALMQVQKLMTDFPWADWKVPYDQIGARLEAVKSEADRRKTPQKC